MSAIAGICYWDGRPVADATLASMASFLQPGGPDGGGTISPAPGVVMQTYLLHFDSLSKQERQPHAFGQACLLSWDGRLDNRDDLLIALHYDLGPDVTDAALVAAAYTRWGLDAPRRLIGDWSLALWDGAQHRLLLACDYMANRPLFYLERPGGLAWASGLEALAEAFDLYGAPSEEYIAGRLAGINPPDVTPYAGARALTAGHQLVATESAGVRVQRYWTLEPTTIRYTHLHDYADHTRALLTEAVRVRLRSNRRVWAHLSGGWDSSSIVCLAHALISRGHVEAPAVQPISVVCPDAPESDETRYIEAVEHWVGLTSVRQPYSPQLPTFSQLSEGYRPGHHREEDAYPLMRSAGERVVLSGEMGDLVMLRGASQAISLLEPLHQGHVGLFLRLCFARTRRRKQPLLTTLARLAWLGYAPQQVDRIRYERKGRAARARELGVSPRDRAASYGMTTELFARVPVLSSPPSVAAFPRVKRPYVEGMSGFAESPSTSCDDLLPDIWTTYPFGHRALVEFIAGVPQLAFWDPVFSRAGMKRAMDGLLPPAVLSRASKGVPVTATTRADRSSIDAILDGGMPTDAPGAWQMVKRGYARQDVLEHVIAALQPGAAKPSDFLMECIRLEAWLRSLEKRRAREPAHLIAPVRVASALKDEPRASPLAEVTSF